MSSLVRDLSRLARYMLEITKTKNITVVITAINELNK